MPHALADVREPLVEKLEAANYPVGDVDVVERADESIEVVATLVSTAVEAAELDAVAADLARRPGVRHATWDVRTRTEDVADLIRAWSIIRTYRKLQAMRGISLSRFHQERWLCSPVVFGNGRGWRQ